MNKDVPEWFKYIESLLDKWPWAAYGPGHIVFDDYNIDDPCIKSCIDMALLALGEEPEYGQYEPDHYGYWLYEENHTPAELTATLDALRYLLTHWREERETWDGDERLF